MDGALLEITNTTHSQRLLHYDNVAHKAKMKEETASYGIEDLPESVAVESNSSVEAFNDVLAFITAAQEKCYTLFGQYMQSGEAAAAAAEDGDEPNSSEDTTHIHSSEWSQAAEETETRKKRDRAD